MEECLVLLGKGLVHMKRYPEKQRTKNKNLRKGIIMFAGLQPGDFTRNRKCEMPQPNHFTDGNNLQRAGNFSYGVL